MFASIALALASLPLWLAGGYLLALTLVSGRLPVPSRGAPRYRFAVVVPAHDEASGIDRTLRSLLSIQWPEALRQIVVVADNCTDETASIARSCGVRVMERVDPDLRGKGYALRFAFEHLLADGWADALVVVDADSDVSVDLLAGFAARLDQGAQAIQAFYGVRNPWEGWRTQLMTLAYDIFHRVRGRGRERLGLSCGLRGNGMCLTSDLLRRVPYAAFSMVEDLEYGVQLGRAGVRVWYADEVAVLGDMVISEAAARSQRQRWEGGRSALSQNLGLGLLSDALTQRDRVLLDLALDTMVPPLSVLAICAVLVASAAGGAYGLGWVSIWIFVFAALPLVFLLVHVLRGAAVSDLGARSWLVLFSTAPRYLLWKLSLKLLPGPKGGGWIRTARETKGRKPWPHLPD